MHQKPDKLNVAIPETMDLLLSRRSGSAKTMTGPGPDAEQLRTILTAATRVPDHGKIVPWRFIV
ncbi:MAG: nitroreductase family protein, partial [Micropepsaceae bacterium]